MYYGPLSNDELVGYNPTEITNRKDDTVTTTRISLDHKGTTLKWEIEKGAEADRVADAVIKALTPVESPRTRRKFTRDQLQEIADAWHAAPEGQRNKAVRDLLGVSRQNATNYIHRCRAVGMIAPPSRSRSLPAQSATFSAEIERILAGDS
jgi:hypothetical protein